MESTKRVGVMMDPEQANKRHTRIMAGIYGYAEEHAERHPAWRLVLDDWADHTIADRTNATPPYDGIVGRITGAGANNARRLKVPAVNVWMSSPAQGLPCVFTDYGSSGKLVAEHLLGRGFANMAALIHPTDRALQDQAAMFRQTAEAAGIAQWGGMLEIARASDHREWRQTVRDVTKWMDSLRLPVGLLVREPGHARLIVELAQARGWHIPQDVAIVCSYNEESLCEKPEPSITAVDMPHERCGYEAAKLLDRLIDARRRGEDTFANPQTITLPAAGIVTRFSTDFFAVADTLVQQALRYIAANLARQLSVEAIAEHLDVSRRTLDARFHNAVGATVAAEIRRLRMERVKRELTGTADSIAAIATRNGFTSMRTFHDQFSTTVGMSPQAFRQVGSRRGSGQEN